MKNICALAIFIFLLSACGPPPPSQTQDTPPSTGVQDSPAVNSDLEPAKPQAQAPAKKKKYDPMAGFTKSSEVRPAYSKPPALNAPGQPAQTVQK